MYEYNATVCEVLGRGAIALRIDLGFKQTIDQIVVITELMALQESKANEITNLVKSLLPEGKPVVVTTYPITTIGEFGNAYVADVKFHDQGDNLVNLADTVIQSIQL